MQVVNVHFDGLKSALRFAADGKAQLVGRRPNGKAKGWIAKIEKKHPNESAEEAAVRINKELRYKK